MTNDDFAARLAARGRTAALIAGFDWDQTPLGKIQNWPTRLKTLVDVIVDSPLAMALLWGPEGRLIYNDGYAVIAGDRHPRILGAPIGAAWPEAEQFNADVLQRVGTGQPMGLSNQEFMLRRRGLPDKVLFSLDYSPVRDDEGAVVGVFALVQETTAQVELETRLSNERARFQQMFQQAPTFMTMLSGPDHRIELVNPRYSALVGHRSVIGQTVREALPDAVSQGYVDLLDQVFQSGVAYSAVGSKYAVQAAPGIPVVDRYVDFVFQPLTDSAGKVTGIFVEGVDVTARHRAEVRRATLINLTEAIREIDDPAAIGYTAAAILGDTLQVARVGYGSIDPDTEVLEVARDWNAPGVRTLAGKVPLRDYGSFIDSLKRNELVHIADVRSDGRTLAAAPALEARAARSFVNVPLIEHGQLVAVLYVNHGEIREWTPEDLSLIREVAQRTRTAVERALSQMALRDSELKLREANETLEAKVIARTQALMQAEEALRQAQKMEAVGQLTGGIAHDFNNLLGAISGSLELLEVRMASGRLAGAERFIESAQMASRRAASLTQRLLAFSRRQTLDPKPTDANKLIAGMEDFIRRSVGPNVRVEIVGAVGLWPSLVDAAQLESSLLNLCINARDAMAPDGGRLTIETANKWLDDRAAKERDMMPGQYVSLCVSDTGTGMSPEVIDRAFDPFFTTKPLGAGTGLGLSMVYGFARQSGGQIRVYSEVGKGTTLCLYLPRFVGEAPREETEAAVRIDPGAGETILVVDDETTIRMLVIEVLQEHGYASLEAGDAATALKILQSDARIDLLVTDVGLPGGINGRQVADAARLIRPELKVLFVTGYAENAAVGNGHLEVGMEIMTKPFLMAAFANKIRALLERR